MKKMILIGYGGHAESVADSIRQEGEYDIIGYTDVKKAKETIAYPYLGEDNVLYNMYHKGVNNAVICIGYLGKTNIRDILYKKVKDIGFQLPVIVDRTAVLADNVFIGEGTYIGKGAIINAKSKVGKMCIINSGAVIEHESKIGDFTHVSVKAVLCGNVIVGDHTFIGANTTIIQGLEIGGYSNIGAGSIILRDVPKEMKLYGVWGNKQAEGIVRN